MNKNWGDRADKDLFFTILSVKNIGVITGAEWTTIGNSMRIMGYGFTNEGCRQHFQALRRTQHKKAVAVSTNPDGSPKYDPALNPITRRPGPGRGRPRKNAASTTGEPGAAAQLPPVATQAGDPNAPAPSPVPAQPRHLLPAPAAGIAYHHAHHLPGRSPAPGPPASAPPPGSPHPVQQPVAPMAPMTENDDAPGEDEPPSKRPRVDSDVVDTAVVPVVPPSSGPPKDESADNMEDDDEEEDFDDELGLGPDPADAERHDEVSNHDAEDAVLTLVAASGGADTAVAAAVAVAVAAGAGTASNASSPSWGTPPQTSFDAP
ncbi:hypothetical protein Micbo1qcDRAFT_191609 [Microdochium bolleyi]|uniref:Myb-like domain-containing protein n=1 Tax=Microdochium bolleyi TaxID=196109 RepID=A0A136JIM5_9PEZI|nr:hypothetical protein Micbo1qcDRAFT_191609 [Microdochium bolleyi]